MSEEPTLEDRLNKKFNPDTWIGDTAFRTYKYAGINLIDDINALEPDLVIDAGCGKNRFKGHIKNLIGFDMQQFPFVDIPLGFDQIDFRKESADVVLALGSIQFGNKDLVTRHLEKTLSWIKPGGFLIMRVASDQARTGPNYNKVHYKWTREDIADFSGKYNLKIIKGVDIDEWRDQQGKYIGERWVWWWQKPGERKKYSIDPYSCTIKEVKNDTE